MDSKLLPADAQLISHVHDFVRWASAGQRLADALWAGVPVEQALADFDDAGPA